MIQKVLVTGASGFVGNRLCSLLTQQRINVCRAIHHSQSESVSPDFIVGDVTSEVNWADALGDVNAIIHLAARVHILNDTAENPLAEFRRINTEGTLRLANAAYKYGVKRFVFVSSVKVNGDLSQTPFKETDKPDLTSPYAISKWEAEQLLLDMYEPSRFEPVIVRPPLIYGPQVGANFLQLVRLVDYGLPLPLGFTQNRRSLVGLDNLCEFLMLCTSHAAAGGEIFLVSDGADISTTELVQLIGHHLKRCTMLLPVPRQAVEWPARLLGKTGLITRLWGSLQLDITKAKTILGWQPTYSIDEELVRVIEWYKLVNGRYSK